VFVLDIAKGFVPTYLAFAFSPVEWAAPLAGTMAVVGHCWPLFAGFRGGMGLATFGGAILVLYPLGFAVGLGLLIALALIIRHSARASFLTGLLLAPAYWLLGQSGMVLWLAGGAGLVISIRFLSDWNRKYRELWLDRENAAYEDSSASGGS
jgi:glycerol-3-phosphate acyltransferase PlsY